MKTANLLQVQKEKNSKFQRYTPKLWKYSFYKSNFFVERFMV